MHFIDYNKRNHTLHIIFKLIIKIQTHNGDISSGFNIHPVLLFPELYYVVSVLTLKNIHIYMCLL